MTIKNIMEANLFDDYEQVVILTGVVEQPTIHYKGYMLDIPKQFRELRIESLSSMGERRRNQFNLNKYGWTEIWIEE